MNMMPNKMGLDEASILQAMAHLTQLRTKLKGFQSKSGTCSTTNMAATGIAQVMKAEAAALNQAFAGAQTAIGKALRGQGPSGARFSGKDFAVKVEGQIGLVIPGTQVQASVQGPIMLKVDTLAGTPGGGGATPGEGTRPTTAGRNPATGQFRPGNGGGGGWHSGAPPGRHAG